MTSLPGITDPGPIKHVREGMPVVDAQGEDVGTVSAVQMGDPEAITGQGQQMPGPGGLVAAVARGFGGDSSMSAQEQERLSRVGYVTINGRGALSGEAHVAADRISGVVEGCVRLNLSAADIQHS